LIEKHHTHEEVKGDLVTEMTTLTTLATAETSTKITIYLKMDEEDEQLSKKGRPVGEGVYLKKEIPNAIEVKKFFKKYCKEYVGKKSESYKKL
jgi:hypothetical protein